MPPATAKPSIAAISGLTRRALGDAREAAVPEPGRLALHERAEVHARAEEAARAGEHADRQAVVAVELVERAGDALGERGVDGVSHLGPVERDQQDVAPPLGEDGLVARRLPALRSSGCSLVVGSAQPTRAASTVTPDAARARAQAANRRRSGSRSPRSTSGSTSTHSIPRACASTRAWGLIVWAASTPRQEPSAGSSADPLQVAGQLLDGVDRADALDLDGDPLVPLVAAHQVHGPDVRRPLAADQAHALAAPLRRLRRAAPAARARRPPSRVPPARRARARRRRGPPRSRSPGGPPGAACGRPCRVIAPSGGLLTR